MSRALDLYVSKLHSIGINGAKFELFDIALSFALLFPSFYFACKKDSSVRG
jgi:hypothetical protein